jgi:hypothetical protein
MGKIEEAWNDHQTLGVVKTVDDPILGQLVTGKAKYQSKAEPPIFECHQG